MKTGNFLQIMILLLLFYGCNTPTSYVFIESQSKTIDAYRRQGFYEYATPLNDRMWAVLKSDNTKFLNGTIIETIKKVNDIILEEKNLLGCYIIPWTKEEKDSSSNDIIMLEWNQNAGVIIRVFTKSEVLIEKLPKQSF